MERPDEDGHETEETGKKGYWTKQNELIYQNEFHQVLKTDSHHVYILKHQIMRRVKHFQM